MDKENNLNCCIHADESVLAHFIFDLVSQCNGAGAVQGIHLSFHQSPNTRVSVFVFVLLSAQCVDSVCVIPQETEGKDGHRC